MQAMSKTRPAVIALAFGTALAGSTTAGAQGPGPRTPTATQALPTPAPPDPSLPGRVAGVGGLSPRPTSATNPSAAMTRPGIDAAAAGLGAAPSVSPGPARTPSTAAG